jgi:hypothetical protein
VARHKKKKMTTEQKKARFFGQHIGCKVLVFGAERTTNGTYALNTVRSRIDNGIELYFDNTPYGENGNFDCCKLILRPLSSITDAEAIELFAKSVGLYIIHIVRDDDKIVGIGASGGNVAMWLKTSPLPMGKFMETWNNVSGKQPPEFMDYMAIDYLRSLNFALPFQGVDPIEAGWAVLAAQ